MNKPTLADYTAALSLLLDAALNHRASDTGKHCAAILNGMAYLKPAPVDLASIALSFDEKHLSAVLIVLAGFSSHRWPAGVPVRDLFGADWW